MIDGNVIKLIPLTELGSCLAPSKRGSLFVTEPSKWRLKDVLHRVLTFIEEDLPGILLAITVVALSADVFGRYVLHSPIQGAGEVALIAFIWQTYLAVAAVARHGRHITVDVVTTYLPQRGQAILDIFVQLITLGVLIYLAVAGLEFFTTGTFTRLTGTGLSKKFLELAIPVSALFMIVYSFRDLWNAVRGAITGKFIRAEDEMDDEISRIDDSYVPENLKAEVSR